MSKKDIYNMKNVHFVNMTILTILELLLSILALIGCETKVGLMSVVAAAILIAISVILYRSPVNDTIKAFFFTLIPVIVAICFALSGKMSIMCCHYMFFLSIAMISLYFKRNYIIIYQVLINIIYISLFAVKGYYFLDGKGFNVNLWSFIQVMVCINFVLVILNFLTKWGNAIIKSAEDKEKVSTELAEKLNQSLKGIQENSQILNNNIVKFNKNISSTKEAVSNVNDAIADISNGINDQSEDLRTINEKMTTSSDNIKKSQEISDKVSSQSLGMNSQVEDGYRKVEDMDKQMEIIYQSVNTSNNTVNELQDSIEEINKFLDVITGIAAQTNMLALNAAIEAARAGEHGKGFAVVADEVRQLAESSSSTVNDINHIISDIKQKTNSAVEKSQLGEEAVKSGKELISKVKSTFDAIKNDSAMNSEYLAQNAEMNSATKSEFMNILEKVNKLTDISQNQAAAIEEISATMETTTEDITNISNSVDEINDLSTSLNNMAE